MYFCFHKNNDITDKEIFGMQDMCQKLTSKDVHVLNSFISMSENEIVTLKDYFVYFNFKPRSEFIEIDARNKTIFMRIAKTIEYLHDYGFCMRDITIYNILMQNTSDQGLPRLSNI
mgnify:CR=1 FL=1